MVVIIMLAHEHMRLYDIEYSIQLPVYTANNERLVCMWLKFDEFGGFAYFAKLSSSKA